MSDGSLILLHAIIPKNHFTKLVHNYITIEVVVPFGMRMLFIYIFSTPLISFYRILYLPRWVPIKIYMAIQAHARKRPIYSNAKIRAGVHGSRTLIISYLFLSMLLSYIANLLRKN